jgi:hypothetical protein
MGGTFSARRADRRGTLWSLVSTVGVWWCLAKNCNYLGNILPTQKSQPTVASVLCHVALERLV